MRGKRLSERTMGHTKFDILIDYYLANRLALAQEDFSLAQLADDLFRAVAPSG